VRLRRSGGVKRLCARALTQLHPWPGFEGALLRTNHKNATGLVPHASGFPPGEPCCAVELTDAPRAVYVCAPGGHDTLPADYAYPPLDMASFVARYPHAPPMDAPPGATPAAVPAAQAAPVARREAAEEAPQAAAAAPPLEEQGAVANRAAWVRRLGREDLVAAGGDVFDAVPAAGFDPAFKNPCWCELPWSMH
jgi:hypothetical protein